MNDFIAVSLVLCAAFTRSEPVQPKIITRSIWGARNPKHLGTSFLEIPSLVVVSHSVTPGCTTPDGCKARVKNIQNHHMNVNKWDDIGYNFLVGEDGNVYEGRGWDVVGAHTRGYNAVSTGICMIGDFENRLPDSAAIDAVKNLLEYGVTMGKINSTYILYGHRQLRPTSSPGTKLYELIKTWPHWRIKN